eukprot:12896796-Prorocentrum_lima.AAC.1
MQGTAGDENRGGDVAASSRTKCARSTRTRKHTWQDHEQLVKRGDRDGGHVKEGARETRLR